MELLSSEFRHGKKECNRQLSLDQVGENDMQIFFVELNRSLSKGSEVLWALGLLALPGKEGSGSQAQRRLSD